jgi:two-component system chemotaxis sensor kinase CheA
MEHTSRYTQLLISLGNEIGLTQAGSSQGQFPILDLLGNLRDETAGRPGLEATHQLCAGAWERIVGFVEAGKSFEAADIQWMNDLLPQLRQTAPRAESAPAPSARPAPEPAVPAVPAGPAPVIPDPAAAAAAAAFAAATFPPPAPAPAPVTPAPAPTPPAGAPAAASGDTGDGPLNLDIAGDGELLQEFITESREHLDNIEQGVLVLEKRPTDEETLNTIFRAFHTFKGGAGFLNLIPINRLAHVLESLLDLARQGRLVINGPVIDLILRGRDVLKLFLDEIEGQVAGERPVAPILIPTARLKAKAQGMIDAVHSGKLPVAPANIGLAAAMPEPPAEPAPAGPGEPAAEAKSDGARAMVKVDTAKLDGLLDLVGEMVIAQSLVGQNLSQLAGLDPQLARNTAQLSRITKELQRVSMSLRMVPIRGVFNKMARVTRDLGAKQQKKVRFVTSGEDTELDRGVVEELNDPLLHMIRNSMDHGIEPAAKRLADGKPAEGTLHLRAYHQGGNIVVEIEDDGAGLNRDRILKKAVEQGMVTTTENLSDEDIFSFIFAAGFSTAEKVTDLSGRGVGLDVVRRNIERLRGRVDISSRPGKGTLFKITLPLTLAIIDGLIVKVGEERYIIPTLSVRESFRPKAEMISRVHGRAEVVNVRGRLIPLLQLHTFFGVKPKSTDVTDGIIVVIESGADLRCLRVDSLLHKQEVVIKNLNDMMMHKNRALAGAAILGDGQVGLILDVNALVHPEQSYSQAA